MEQSVFPSQQTPESFNRFAIPVRWGIIWGILSCIITTVQHMFFMDPYALYLGIYGLVFVLALAMYCIAGIQQRKAMGGYIDFKSAFQAIFVVIIISSLISTVYTFIYFKWIDADALNRLQEQTLNSMEKWGAPEASIEDAAAEFEKSKDGQGVGDYILNFAKGLIFSSILGFICAAIVKKKKPEFGV